jgi:hypothetical protein
MIRMRQHTHAYAFEYLRQRLVDVFGDADDADRR